MISVRSDYCYVVAAWFRAIFITVKIFLKNYDAAGFSYRRMAIAIAQIWTRANRIWLSAQLAQMKGHDVGIKFAEYQVHAVQRPAVALLKANASLHAPDYWLQCVNGYLSSAGTGAIGLSPQQKPLFFRLSARCAVSACESADMISVIMPAYNAEKFLWHSAWSILQQTWRNIELIIVDDCSVDNTWDVARTIAAHDNRVRLLRNVENVGPYVSKNLALEVAQGRYVTCHDADDWAHPQRLEIAMRAISDGAVAVLSNMLRMTEEGEFCFYSYNSVKPIEGVRRVAMISLLVERDLIQSHLGGWDNVRFGGDSEFIGRLRAVVGSKLRHIDHVGMFCLDLSGSLTNHPLYGISKVGGTSLIRRQYRQAFQRWHGTLDLSRARMPFPDRHSHYDVPSVMRVPVDHIRANLRAHKNQMGGTA